MVFEGIGTKLDEIYSVGLADSRHSRLELENLAEELRKTSLVTKFVAYLDGLSDTKRKFTGLRVLANLKDPSAIPFLLRLLADETFSNLAIFVLGKIGDPNTANTLIPLLDSDESKKIESAIALGNLGSDKATLPLCSLLRDRSESVRYSAAEALAKIRDEAAVPFIIDAIKENFQYRGFIDPRIKALAVLGTQEALVFLAHEAPKLTGVNQWDQISEITNPEAFFGVVELFDRFLRDYLTSSNNLVSNKINFIIDRLSMAFCGIVIYSPEPFFQQLTADRILHDSLGKKLQDKREDEQVNLYNIGCSLSLDILTCQFDSRRGLTTIESENYRDYFARLRKARVDGRRSESARNAVPFLAR